MRGVRRGDAPSVTAFGRATSPILTDRGGRTREEHKRDKWAAVCRVIVVAAGLVLLLVALGRVDQGPVPGETVGESVAVNVAAQEYARVLEESGSSGLAEYWAGQRYQEVLDSFGTGETDCHTVLRDGSQ